MDEGEWLGIMKYGGSMDEKVEQRPGEGGGSMDEEGRGEDG